MDRVSEREVKLIKGVLHPLADFFSALALGLQEIFHGSENLPVTYLLRQRDRIGKLQHALWVSEGQILNVDILFHTHKHWSAHACNGDQS